MLNWYHKKAPKNTIVRYLSSKYSPEELQNLTYLELPEQFESLDYADELNLILKDSPWKASEVKYKTSSLKSLKGIFTKEWWFGKKVDEVSEGSVNSEEETKDPLAESVYFETKESDEETSSVNDEISIWDQILDKKDDIELARAKLAGKASKESWETEEGLKDWIRENEKQKAELEALIETFTYQFRLNENSSIVLWKKAEDNKWEEEPYQGCFLDLNKTYQNCWVTIQTIQPLPTELPEGVNCLFELVASQEELIKKNDWDYGLVTRVQSVEESESESSETDESETESETELKGTYRYEFKTDNQGLIINWRTPSSEWKEPEIFQGKYFSLDIARYANSYLKVKTLEPLPRNLATSYLFAPCLTEKDFYSQEPNWTSCLVWEQSSLEPIPNHHENHEETPTNLIKWWNNNKNWVIITGVTVLLIALWKE